MDQLELELGTVYNLTRSVAQGYVSWVDWVGFCTLWKDSKVQGWIGYRRLKSCENSKSAAYNLVENSLLSPVDRTGLLLFGGSYCWSSAGITGSCIQYSLPVSLNYPLSAIPTSFKHQVPSLVTALVVISNSITLSQGPGHRQENVKSAATMPLTLSLMDLLWQAQSCLALPSTAISDCSLQLLQRWGHQTRSLMSTLVSFPISIQSLFFQFGGNLEPSSKPIWNLAYLEPSSKLNGAYKLEIFLSLWLLKES